MKRIVRSKILPGESDEKLLDYLVRRFTYRNYAEWKDEISAGRVQLNEIEADGSELLSSGGVITYLPPEIVEPEVDKNYQISFEDEYLLVINKPANLPVHPSGVYFQNTLWCILMEKYGNIFPVNRLDSETSGLLVFAKDTKTASRTRIEEKIYFAAVHGEFSQPIEADGFIGPDDSSLIRKKRKFVRDNPENPSFSPCHTTLIPVKSQSGFSLIKAVLHSGKTHQIRATLFSLGFPLIGDKIYGIDEQFFLRRLSDSLSTSDFDRLILPYQALHSSHLSFRHAVSGERIECDAPFPELWRVKLPFLF